MSGIIGYVRIIVVVFLFLYFYIVIGEWKRKLESIVLEVSFSRMVSESVFNFRGNGELY